MNYQVGAVAVGAFRSLILLGSGEVYDWSNTGSVNLENINTKENNPPQLIKNIPGKVMGISAGVCHSLALLDSGEIYGWDDNVPKQLGNRITKKRKRPQLIKNIPDKVIKISAGDFHSLALLETGKVYGWGLNGDGQLGDGSTKKSSRPQLMKTIPGKVVDIATGTYHSLVLLESGKVYGWGRNGFGQLGDGTNKDRNLPQLITSLPSKVVGIAAGDNHSLAVLKSGKVYGWGCNIYDQLGDGTAHNRKRPQVIDFIQGKVVALAGSYQHSLALLENGKVCGWGENGKGQLGNDLPRDVPFPHLVSNIDKRILLCPFGKGGRAIGFTELENKYRELLNQEIRL